MLHFGIREHAMGAIMNGIALHGGTRVFGGAFLVFSDYMRPAVRLAALMKLPVTYVWTHDSIGLGEDGPTHQPIEHLAALRAIPGLSVVRPADANETAYAWRTILDPHRPARSGLILTRQNLPVLDGTTGAEGVAQGRLRPGRGRRRPPTQVILIATGSEVQLAVAARDDLPAEGIDARVVSLPCLEWFDEQDAAYRDSVLPPGGDRAGLGRGRHRPGLAALVGDAGRIVVARALRRLRRLQAPLQRVRHHRRGRRRRRRGAAGWRPRVPEPDPSPSTS